MRISTIGMSDYNADCFLTIKGVDKTGVTAAKNCQDANIVTYCFSMM